MFFQECESFASKRPGLRTVIIKIDDLLSSAGHSSVFRPDEIASKLGEKTSQIAGVFDGLLGTGLLQEEKYLECPKCSNLIDAKQHEEAVNNCDSFECTQCQRDISALKVNEIVVYRLSPAVKNTRASKNLHAKVTIKLIETGGKLEYKIDGTPNELIQRLRDSYKLTAIIIAAGAYNNETPRSLTQLTNNLIRYGFKKGRTIRGRSDSKTREKNLEREVKKLNKYFEDVKMPLPLIKELSVLKWNDEISGFISFVDTNETELKTDALRNLLSKYKLSTRGKELSTKHIKRAKVKPLILAPNNLDYAAHPSRQSVQAKLIGKKIKDESNEDY